MRPARTENQTFGSRKGRTSCAKIVVGLASFDLVVARKTVFDQHTVAHVLCRAFQQPAVVISRPTGFSLQDMDRRAPRSLFAGLVE